MPTRKTEKEVRTYLSKLGLELQSDYRNNKTELERKYIDCGQIFNRTFNHIFKNPKYPKCYPPITARRSLEKVREIIESKPGHKLLSTKYINKSKTIKIKCEITDEEVETTLASYLKSKGCKACWLKKMRGF